MITKSNSMHYRQNYYISIKKDEGKKDNWHEQGISKIINTNVQLTYEKYLASIRN